MYIKRIFTKFLPLTLLVVMFVMYMSQQSGSEKTFKLLDTLIELQSSQIINTAKQMELMNASHAVNDSMTEGEELLVTTRQWFDERPQVSPSLKRDSEHPRFRGYLIENPNACEGVPVDVLIYIHSSPENREMRSAIRETWGSTNTFSDISVKLIFFIGGVNDKDLQLQIETEYSTHGDLVQGNFLDVFTNLTYKAVTMLAWVNSHCFQAKYLMKVDDDMFVDTFAAVREVVPQLALKPLAVACDYKVHMPIPRDPKSRWNVPPHLVPKRSHWPPFCSGYFAVFTSTLIPILYEASFTDKDFVPGDDVYLFGLLSEQKNISYEVANIQRRILPIEKPKAEDEVFSIQKFQHLAFRVPSPDIQRKLWSVRFQVLSNWEKAHSYFHNTFLRAKAKGTLVV
ncbi:lactosylceramide -n-acetyl-beta-d-glucosaminyltransferase [Biomphalaria pfeifferi]|uniref:Hexosyltransferase n=1 Tax=Biomphalaria pfeifferi TaxID=112525 RepID=A0AAD8BDM0_BIOPF|nr:lactosylceramide -n-acetyl-beta-d-glucosaminyltransferase [Biomphalaria pfeifferi]